MQLFGFWVLASFTHTECTSFQGMTTTSLYFKFLPIANVYHSLRAKLVSLSLLPRPAHSPNLAPKVYKLNIDVGPRCQILGLPHDVGVMPVEVRRLYGIGAMETVVDAESCRRSLLVGHFHWQKPLGELLLPTPPSLPHHRLLLTQTKPSLHKQVANTVRSVHSSSHSCDTLHMSHVDV